MGDSQAPGKDRDAAKGSSSTPPTSTKSTSSRPSAAPSVGSALAAKPVVSVSSAPVAKVISTSPPMTEDIDSEWPSDPEASAEPVGSLAPGANQVDSGWLNVREADQRPAAALTEPNFPSDPALPSELWGAAAAESRRGGKDSSTPLVTTAATDKRPRTEQRAAEPASVAPIATAVAPIATAPAVTTDVVAPYLDSMPRTGAERESTPAVLPPRPPASRGKVVALGLLGAAALAGLWFARGGDRSRQEPGVQALRPEATHVEAAQVGPANAEPAKAEPAQAQPAKLEPAQEPKPAEPATGAASPSGVELTGEQAAAPASANAEAPAPSGSATSSPGKIVVIVNVRPPQARIFYRGKEAGKAPLRVELDPGQRRSFEVGYPGFMTRKIVVDGSKPELLVGLRASSPYATGSAPPGSQN